jgi:hypothetical protein
MNARIAELRFFLSALFEREGKVGITRSMMRQLVRHWFLSFVGIQTPHVLARDIRTSLLENAT